MVESRGTVRPGKRDTAQMALEKEDPIRALKMNGYRGSSHCASFDDQYPLAPGQQTLFVNASVQGLYKEEGVQLPWVIDIELPIATKP